MSGKASEFCWQLWNAQVKVTAGTDRLLLKAYDTSGNFMPQRVPWNAKGYLQNSWYTLPVKVSCVAEIPMTRAGGAAAAEFYSLLSVRSVPDRPVVDSRCALPRCRPVDRRESRHNRHTSGRVTTPLCLHPDRHHACSCIPRRTQRIPSPVF